ncbi:WYL domain-containing protein [Brevibacillus porteri]|uniref:WYL domain-containing protein n=2 Tax=Brevibacillus porteri TaxID=2126350 RepID=A0ABX5FHR3_9BACL|nr:WYL domain-containing protein [Brevibacillus porteri]
MNVMARESFDKELQLLRLLFLTAGAYNRQQLAERLGISVHTLDKTIKKLKDIQSTFYQHVGDEEKKEYYAQLRYNYFEVTDNFLMFLYHAKSLKDSEVERLSHILEKLRQQPLSIKDLLDTFVDTEPDEKTIRQDMKYLEEIGVIKNSSEVRPYVYQFDGELLDSLTDDELLDLYDFIDFMANTQLPAVPGYLLQEKVKRYLKYRLKITDASAFLYKYHFVSRILDEYQALLLTEAIRQRKIVEFHYYTPKRRKFYDSQNTNPAFQRDSSGRHQKVIPLRVIFDHQYGRWYLLAQGCGNGPLRKYRVEGMTKLVTGNSVTPEIFSSLQASADERIAHSWLIDTGKLVTVRLRFFQPRNTPHSFIQERVEAQGQWGIVTEESRESFVYEINVNSTMEITPWIRSFGSSVEVLEPLFLRKQFQKEWEELLAYYESV